MVARHCARKSESLIDPQRAARFSVCALHIARRSVSRIEAQRAERPSASARHMARLSGFEMEPQCALFCASAGVAPANAARTSRAVAFSMLFSSGSEHLDDCLLRNRIEVPSGLRRSGPNAGVDQDHPSVLICFSSPVQSILPRKILICPCRLSSRGACRRISTASRLVLRADARITSRMSSSSMTMLVRLCILDMVNTLRIVDLPA